MFGGGGFFCRIAPATGRDIIFILPIIFPSATNGHQDKPVACLALLFAGLSRDILYRCFTTVQREFMHDVSDVRRSPALEFNQAYVLRLQCGRKNISR